MSDGLIGPGAFAGLLGFRAVEFGPDGAVVEATGRRVFTADAEITQSGRVVARATTTNLESG